MKLGAITHTKTNMLKIYRIGYKLTFQICDYDVLCKNLPLQAQFVRSIYRLFDKFICYIPGCYLGLDV